METLCHDSYFITPTEFEQDEVTDLIFEYHKFTTSDNKTGTL